MRYILLVATIMFACIIVPSPFILAHYASWIGWDETVRDFSKSNLFGTLGFSIGLGLDISVGVLYCIFVPKAVEYFELQDRNRERRRAEIQQKRPLFS